MILKHLSVEKDFYTAECSKERTILLLPNVTSDGDLLNCKNKHLINCYLMYHTPIRLYFTLSVFLTNFNLVQKCS